MATIESFPPGSEKVEYKLKQWSRQLHDLSGRNRLLFYRETRASSATIENPALPVLFQLLVEKGQELKAPLPTARDLERFAQEPVVEPLTSLASDGDEADRAADSDPGDEDALAEELAPEFELPAARPTAESSSSSKSSGKPKKNELVTNHSPAQLNHVLYNLHYMARTVQEEQGIHILYLTLGMLRWKDLRNTAFTQAPLILVPVQIERDNPNSAYRIRMAEEDILLNPPLQIKLSTDFGLSLPEVSNDLSSAALETFMEQVAKRVSKFDGWEVTEQVTLGAFNFLTLQLVKDLERYASIYKQHPFVQLLSGVQGVKLPAPEHVPQASELDDLVNPSEMFQVLDADSSQQEAIEAAKRGLSFVLQGPPGTGKSQTIANIIVESMMAGKRVLFVSQKIAALEVVKKRLALKGLQEFCLEIHNHRMDKRRIVQDLMASLSHAPLQLANPNYRLQQEELKRIRDDLNAYVRQLHEPRFELGLSLFQAQSRLAEALSAPQLSFTMPAPERVTAGDYSHFLALIREAIGYAELIANYSRSRWMGYTGLETSLHDRDALAHTFEATWQAIEKLHREVTDTATEWGLPSPETIQDDLDYALVLKYFTPGIFTPDMQEVLARQVHQGGQFVRLLDAQHRKDMAALKTVSRPGSQPSKEELARILAFVRKTIRGGPNLEDALTGDSRQHAELAKLVDQVESGFDLALTHFHPDELPEALSQKYDQSPEEAADWFSDHGQHTDELAEWTQFNLLREEFKKSGLEDFVIRALEAQLPPENWEEAFVRRFHAALIERLMADRPVLQKFRGATQSELVQRFRALDLAMIENSAREVKAKLHKNKPQWDWLKAESAETSILRREANKKRRLMPLRKLFSEIPNLIQSLKPCLMMSPLTVCQLLDPSIYQFDIVVFDEASQIPPAYAISAFLRAKQVIVAGDSQQLPPTNFFQNLEAEGADQFAEDQGDDIFESILSACDSSGFPNKLLNWHYRSKDESLIAYSNYHFYDNRLYTFPNSSLDNPMTGLKFVYVPNAIYKGGAGARYNIAEAKRVAELVYEHLMHTPNLSLGIVTLSFAQRRAVEAEIEKLRMEHPDLNELFTYDAAEPIFVKNLENVQGDERDAIILSIGYGKDAAGKIALNFGPINQEGGARRLNVAVTRARYLLKLVASIQPEDIDLTRAMSRGAFLLRNYLEAARDGVGAVFQDRRQKAETQLGSDFERLVQTALSQHGLELVPHLGVSQYRIDLAVVNPERPGNYLLGIECDGPMYQSAATARDRERLRQQVLEGLGWKLHRVWSRDWIRNPEAEIEKILNAVRQQKKPVAEVSRDPMLGNEEIVDRESDEPAQLDAERQASAEDTVTGPVRAKPYEQWKLEPKKSTGREAFLSAAFSQLIDDFQAIANAEGPISIKVAKSVVLEAWDVRSSKPVQERLDAALERGIAQKAFRLNGTFLWPIGLRVAPLRVHMPGQPARPIGQIAPEEIQGALRECVRAAITISREDLLRETCGLFGLKSTAQNLAAIDELLQQLLDADALAEEDGRIGSGNSNSQRV